MLMTTTNGWTVMEAIATLGGSIILAIGAVAGGRYGRKANPNVESWAHLRPNGRVVLVAKASVSAPGVLPIRIETDFGHVPTIGVTEVREGSGGGLQSAAKYAVPVFAEELKVGGGETISRNRVFHLPNPTPDLVGWRVDFFVDVPRRFTFRRRWWTWAVDTFVKVPDAT